MENVINLNVRLFASLRDKFSKESLEFSVPVGSSVSSFLRLFNLKYSAICSLDDSIMIAVNEEYADSSLVLENGDEVALIPPVSGG